MSCPVCHHDHAPDPRAVCALDRQGRRLVDLLDAGAVPEQVRKDVLSGRWSEETALWLRDNL